MCGNSRWWEERQTGCIVLLYGGPTAVATQAGLSTLSSGLPPPRGSQVLNLQPLDDLVESCHVRKEFVWGPQLSSKMRTSCSLYGCFWTIGIFLGIVENYILLY